MKPGGMQFFDSFFSSLYGTAEKIYCSAVVNVSLSFVSMDFFKT